MKKLSAEELFMIKDNFDVGTEQIKGHDYFHTCTLLVKSNARLRYMLAVQSGRTAKLANPTLKKKDGEDYFKKYLDLRKIYIKLNKDLDYLNMEKQLELGRFFTDGEN